MGRRVTRRPVRFLRQMVPELGTQRAFQQRFLEAPRGGLHISRREHPFGGELIQNRIRDGGEHLTGYRTFLASGHGNSSC